MINDVFITSVDVLEKINAEWDALNFIGVDFFNKQNNYFVFSEDFECVTNDFLQQWIKRINDEGRTSCDINSYSDEKVYPHYVNMLFDTETSSVTNYIYLNPTTFVESQLSSLLKNKQVSVNKHQFTSNDEVNTFLNRIYDFCREKDVVLVGRYIRDNVFFDFLKRSRGSLKICTIKPDELDQNTIRRSIGNRSFSVKKGKLQENHQRMIKMKKIIIVCDIDFDCLKVDDATWSISVFIDDKVYSGAERDIGHFR